MPYLDGRGFDPITTFGKPDGKTSDQKFEKWIQHAPFAKDKLKFGLTHPDKIISQVREKKTQGFGIKMSNLYNSKNGIPSAKPITTFGKPSGQNPGFSNYPQSQFKVQSSQIQNRRGSTIQQQKTDGKA